MSTLGDALQKALNEKASHAKNDYSNFVWKGQKRKEGDRYVQDSEKFIEMTPERLKECYKHCDKMLNSDDPSFTLYDIIDGLSNGIDIYTVSLWYKNNYNMEAVTIDEDNLTLDNIREFYLNQEKLRYIDRCNHIDEFEEIEREHEINSLFINAIYNIKGFNDEYQDIYLNIVKKILSKENIDRQIRDIINLTKVYLEFGEQITEFSIEEIEHYIELGGKKYENR